MNAAIVNTVKQCGYFNQGQCLSCRHIQQPMVQQVAVKTQTLQQLLAPFIPANLPDIFQPPVIGEDSGFRNKAKMVALGAAHAPVLGIVGPSGEAVDLCDCLLYPSDMQDLLHRLTRFVQQADFLLIG